MSRSSKTRASRDERIRREVFPEADVFDTKTRGFVPLPIEYRRLLKYMTLAQLRVWLYLNLRASKHGICFPTVDEIAHEIGVSAVKHVRPLLKDLEGLGFIKLGAKAGRTYFLINDPASVIRTLVSIKKLSAEDLRELNALREDIGHEPVLPEGL